MDDKKYAQVEDAETEILVMQLWNREQEEEAEIPKKKGAEGQGHLKPGKDNNGGESKLTSDETHKESESANRVRGKGLGRRRHGWHSRCHGKRTRRGTNTINAVTQEGERLLVRLKMPNLVDYEEMVGLKEVPT